MVLASPDNEKTQKRGKWVQDAAIQDSNTDQLPPHATLCNTNYENYQKVNELDDKLSQHAILFNFCYQPTNQWTTKPILMMNWDLSPIAVVECLLFMSNCPFIVIIKLNI